MPSSHLATSGSRTMRPKTPSESACTSPPAPRSTWTRRTTRRRRPPSRGTCSRAPQRAAPPTCRRTAPSGAPPPPSGRPRRSPGRRPTPRHRRPPSPWAGRRRLGWPPLSPPCEPAPLSPPCEPARRGRARRGQRARGETARRQRPRVVANTKKRARTQTGAHACFGRGDIFVCQGCNVCVCPSVLGSRDGVATEARDPAAPAAPAARHRRSHRPTDDRSLGRSLGPQPEPGPSSPRLASRASSLRPSTLAPLRTRTR